MKRKTNPPVPSQLETTILSLLWKRDGMTARQVLEALPDGKKRAYTSVLSVLQVMEKKGLVRHTSQGVAHLYHATVEKQKVIGPMVRNMVANFFGGSAATALQHLMDEAEIDEAELKKINQIIRDHKKEKP